MDFLGLVKVVGDEPVFESGLLLAGAVDPPDVQRQLSRWVASGRLYQLRRGSTDPRLMPHNFKNQLIWYTPEDEPAQLLWCNSNGEWFNCIFQREDPAQLS